MAAESGGTYLPPVVATLVAESGSFARTLVDAKAMLKDFSASDTTAKVNADIGGVTSRLAIAVSMLVAFSRMQYNAKLGLDTTPFLLEMAKLEAEMKVIQSAGIGALAAPYLMGAAMGGGGGGGRSRGGGGGALGAAEIAALLGFGGRHAGFGIPGLAGFGGIAGFGTAGGLAGFSAEHVLTVLLGLVGSLSEAFAGLGVIASGAFATMAVGMGSDMLVMRSVISDTQSLYQAQQKVAQAVAVYGANSRQAAVATDQLNALMASLGNTAGVQAEAGLAQAAAALNSFWDQASSGARVQAVNILAQILTLARTYIPLVTQAAEQNLGIINTALIPLFTWLQGPGGTGIFLHLESIFRADLPTAMDAFDNAIEFLLKFLDLASTYTSGFVQWLDHLFRYLNSPAGFAKVKKDVADVVKVFETWKGFVVILTEDIFLLLGQTVGMGTSIIQVLTVMLTHLHTWLESTSGKKAIGSLFEAHKAEILAIIGLLPKLAPLASIYLALAVPFTQIAVALIGIVNAMLSIPTIGPILAWAGAALLMAGRLGILMPLLRAFKIDILAAAVATEVWDAAIAFATGPIGLIIIGVALLVAGAVLLITHWKQVSQVLNMVWSQIKDFVGRILSDIGKFFSNLGTIVEKGWSEFARRPGYWIGYLIGFVIGKLYVLDTDILKWFSQIVGRVVAWGEDMAAKAPGAIGAFSAAAVAELKKLPGQFYSIGGDIVRGLINGIKAMGPWAISQIGGFFAGLVKGAHDATRSSSESKVFAELGTSIPRGVALGIRQETTAATVALAVMFHQMLAQGRMLSRGNFGVPALALAGGGRLASGVSISAPITVNVSGATAATPQGIGTAVQQAVAREFDALIHALQGGVYSTPGS